MIYTILYGGLSWTGLPSFFSFLKKFNISLLGGKVHAKNFCNAPCSTYHGNL